MAMPLPQIVQVNGRPQLQVDGRPFLILGLQWDCDSCFSRAEMNPLFAHAARMGANTAALPLYWREIEPEPGVYDFDMLDERLAQARANGLRLVLLWFATWKNACSFYAPDYIKQDPKTYRLAQDAGSQPTVSLCPTCAATWERDNAALQAVMAHLAEYDAERSVILFQVENEPGILGSDRCYCDACNQEFTAGGWAERYGDEAAEAFSVASVMGYIDRLAQQARTVYPLPLYTNVWMGAAVGHMPGREYPSGGAVGRMLALAKEHTPHLDLIAPDIYTHGYREFRRACLRYQADGNPLYVAEASSSLTGRAERNVFYALGEHGAIGFDPWAIDSPFPETTGHPLVDPVGGEWGVQAYWLRDSYVSIGAALEIIAAAQGTERLFTFVQEPGETRAAWAADGCDVLINYLDREGSGRGMVVQLSADEFLCIGVSYSVQFRRPRPSGQPRAVERAEWGRYEQERWVVQHPMRRERPESLGWPLSLQEPGVARVFLAPR
jgi:hypothetical protein